MERIVIIGGGASGLVTGIYAKNDDNEVIILERNSECGKKLLVTGNGKCNYWNEDQSLSHYHSENNELISEIITFDNQKEILNLFNKLGIIPKIKQGYYYPFSNQAETVREALIKEVNKKNIEIKTNYLVENVKRNKNKFVITSRNEKIEADKVIISTGSFASPKTGSTGMGYHFLSKLGHSIIEPLPALVQLIAKFPYLKDWKGIRTDVILKLEEDEKIIAEDKGELQLTDYGISGICTFNLSSYVSRGLKNNKEEIIHINFLPFLKEDSNIMKWFDDRNKLLNNPTLYELLNPILNYKLVKIILKVSRLQGGLSWDDLFEEEQLTLVENLINFKLEIINTKSFDNAQCCSGGIPLTEIDLKTMESLKVKNLYITGELLDINGDCGGYNLSLAWISGMLAGRASKENK